MDSRITLAEHTLQGVRLTMTGIGSLARSLAERQDDLASPLKAGVMVVAVTAVSRVYKIRSETGTTMVTESCLPETTGPHAPRR